MKKILSIICFFVFTWLPSNGQEWEWQYPKPQGNWLNSVWVFDSNNVVTVGGNGTVLKTTDKGVTWRILYQIDSASANLTSLQFINRCVGWCVGGKSLFQTSDGGQTWFRHTNNFGINLSSVFFIDDIHGWVSGENTVWRTINGGVTWDSSIISDYYTISSIYFVNERLGWVALQTKVYKTTNGGSTWFLSLSSNDDYDYSVFFADSLHGWVGGKRGQWFAAHLLTTDGGTSWIDRSWDEVIYDRLQSIQFVNSMHGWAMASNYLYESVDGGWTWDSVASIGSLSSLHVTRDGSHLWAVGGQGFITSSTNGGIEWNNISSHAGSSFDVKFCNPLVGWAVGGGILKTTNGGKEWFPQYQPGGTLHSLFVLDTLTAWCVGEEWSVVYHTTDGGEQWTKQYAPQNFRGWYKVFFLNKNLGWLAGRFGSYAKTTDGGNQWIAINSGTPDDLGSVFFLDSLNGWLVGNGGSIMKSTDGGMTWTEVSTVAFPHQLSDISFTSNQIGWVSGTSTLLKTTNGGVSWFDINSLHITSWQHKFLSDDVGWAVGPQGIIATVDGGKKWQFLPNSPSGYGVDIFDSVSIWVACGAGILHTPASSVIQPPYVQCFIPGRGVLFSTGWNLISLPLETSERNPSIVFPNISSKAYRYNKGYQITDTLEIGKGYWVKSQDERFHFLHGDSMESVMVELSQGWNLIGGITQQINVSNVIQDSADLIISPFYEYTSGTYQLSNVLSPGKGYWIKTQRNGSITLASDTGSILLQSLVRYLPINPLSFHELPPSPPWQIEDFPSPPEITVALRLEQSYPNPFNSLTEIKYTLAKEMYVTLKVYNVLGEEIITLVEGVVSAGDKHVQWDASHVPSGIYFYKLTSGISFDVKKAVILK
ncbi:MAG: T9SS type A sorting domain-containing protein [Ignavibacteriae bacterium]|nr:T9SS type A sorting domain-containing protein [Ignavibacteriota bacterium]